MGKTSQPCFCVCVLKKKVGWSVPGAILAVTLPTVCRRFLQRGATIDSSPDTISCATSARVLESFIWCKHSYARRRSRAVAAAHAQHICCCTYGLLGCYKTCHNKQHGAHAQTRTDKDTATDTQHHHHHHHHHQWRWLHTLLGSSKQHGVPTTHAAPKSAPSPQHIQPQACYASPSSSSCSCSSGS